MNPHERTYRVLELNDPVRVVELGVLGLQELQEPLLDVVAAQPPDVLLALFRVRRRQHIVDVRFVALAASEHYASCALPHCHELLEGLRLEQLS